MGLESVGFLTRFYKVVNTRVDRYRQTAALGHELTLASDWFEVADSAPHNIQRLRAIRALPRLLAQVFKIIVGGGNFGKTILLETIM